MRSDTRNGEVDGAPPLVRPAADPAEPTSERAGRGRSRRGRLRQRIELLSSAVMAAATIATAWSAYQSSLWSSAYTRHRSHSLVATIEAGKYGNLAMQRLALHVNLFAQWAYAFHRGDARLADFIQARFPEPLRAAMAAWEATEPFTNPAAAATPFDVAEYELREQREADRWEEVALRESDAAERASELSGRYLLFTIAFALVLFFAGISGKFGWQALDVGVLALGALTLVVGVALMLSLPSG